MKFLTDEEIMFFNELVDLNYEIQNYVINIKKELSSVSSVNPQPTNAEAFLNKIKKATYKIEHLVDVYLENVEED